jgi:Tfp pilus assembly protein FimT
VFGTGADQTRGVSFVETTVVMCVGVILTSLALPMAGAVVDEGRARQAAAFVAARLRDAKQRAVTRTASAGLVFDLSDGRWLFNVCMDGNANGLRRADVRNGTDACPGAAIDLAALFPGVTVASDTSIRGPDNDPPSADPVRFGASDIASFSPSGGCTAGSVFLRSTKGARYAVRIAGTTGRLRVLRYDTGARIWREQ